MTPTVLSNLASAYIIIGTLGSLLIGAGAGSECAITILGNSECSQNAAVTVGVAAGTILVIAVTAAPLYALAALIAKVQDLEQHLRSARDSPQVGAGTSPPMVSAPQSPFPGHDPQTESSRPDMPSQRGEPALLPGDATIASKSRLLVAEIARHQSVEMTSRAIKENPRLLAIQLSGASGETARSVIAAAVRLAADRGTELEFFGASDLQEKDIRDAARQYQMIVASEPGDQPVRLAPLTRR